MTFIKDLFKGLGNQYWDLGRIMAFLAFLPIVFATLYNTLVLNQPLDIMALGGGIAAVLGSAAALIAAKDIARTQAASKGVENAQ